MDNNRHNRRKHLNGLQNKRRNGGATKTPRNVVYHREGDTARVNAAYLFNKRRAMLAVLNPDYVTPVKTLADMTPEEIAALEERYSAKVKK